MPSEPPASPLEVLLRAADALALDPVQRQRLLELNAEWQTTRALEATPALDALVARAVAERLKDAKVVEIEIAQAVAERLLAWAKTFALLVGVPLALLAVVLGILGINSWSDFNGTVAQGKKDIQAKITVATSSAAKLDVQARQLDGQYADLKRKFGDVSALASQVEGLSSKVTTLEEKVEFKNMGGAGSSAQQRVGRLIADYRTYLRSLGYAPKSAGFEFVVDPKTEMNAYYDGQQMVVAPEIVDMPDMILHAYGNRAAKEMQPESWNLPAIDIGALYAGISDYLACSYTGNPITGRDYVRVYRKSLPAGMFPKGYMRNMVNSLPFPAPGTTGDAVELHNLGEVWSGVFWELRRIVGCGDASPRCPVADRIVVTTWRTIPLANGAKFRVRFASLLVSNVAAAVGAEAAARAKSAFVRRGVAL